MALKLSSFVQEGVEEELINRVLSCTDYSDIEEGEEEDSKKFPSTAQEYLSRVIREAKRLDGVIIAKNPPKEIQEPLYQVHFREKIKTPQNLKLPGDDWIESRNREFSELRTQIPRHFALLKKYNILGSRPKNLPKNLTEKEFAIFCLGSSFWNLLIESDEERDKGQSLEDIIPPTLPTLNVLVFFNQSKVNALLDHCTNWLEELSELPHQNPFLIDSDNPSTDLGAWLYAALALIEKPVLPDNISVIRKLALVSAKIRSKDQNNLQVCNLFVALASNYFGQTDLKD